MSGPNLIIKAICSSILVSWVHKPSTGNIPHTQPPYEYGTANPKKRHSPIDAHTPKIYMHPYKSSIATCTQHNNPSQVWHKYNQQNNEDMPQLMYLYHESSIVLHFQEIKH